MLFCFWAANAGAQPAFAYALETTAHYSTIWKHTPKLTIRTGQPLWGQELGLRVQTLGRKPWQEWQRYPLFGVSLAYFQLGDQAHRQAWGVLPNLSVPVLRSGRWLAVFRVGTGVGYVTDPYNFFSNPDENAIGSHWNNYTQFRLGIEWRWTAHWRLQAGASLNHFSNGATELPNFGVNLPSGFAAVAWSPRGIRESEFIRTAGSKRGGRRWGGMLTGGLALVEYSVFDGPRYPVWALGGGVVFHLNRVNRLMLGAEYEYNRAVYEFGLRSTDFRTESEARGGATRLACTLADEFLFGNLGVQVLAGVYTGSGINRLVGAPWYSKLTTRYYFPALFHSPLRFHTGISLKAHRTTAEFISLGAGLVF